MIISVGCGVAAAAMLWLFVGTFVPLARALRHHAPFVKLTPRDAAALPLGVVLLSFTAIGLIPTLPTDLGKTPRLHTAARAHYELTKRRGAACLMVALVGLVASSFASPVAYAVVDAAATRNGFVVCRSSPSLRRPKYAWAWPVPGRPQANCPRFDD